MAPEPSLVSGSATPASAVAAADRRADRRRAALVADLAIPDGARPGERERALVFTLLRAAVRATAREIGAELAEPLDWSERSEADVLAALLADPDMADALIAAARTVVIDEALVATRTPRRKPELLAGWLDHDDAAVAERARAFVVEEAALDPATDVALLPLPAALHRRLCWAVAAALRLSSAETSAARDRALAAGAAAAIRRHGARVEPLAAAVRLAHAVAPDAEADAASALLLGALTEARVTLFAGLLARWLAIAGEEARALVLDPEGSLLWLALRALGLSREEAARIGFVLSEADPARDSERLPDMLDAAWTVIPDEARSALAPLGLHVEFRAALRRLGFHSPEART